jgi:hypothetical protein
MENIKRGDTVKLSVHGNGAKYKVLGISKPLPLIESTTKVLLQRKDRVFLVEIQKIKQKY